MRAALLVVFCLALAGCSTPQQELGPASDIVAPLPSSLRPFVFEPAIHVNSARGEGFEPSLRIAPDGTIYLAAARGFFAGDDGSAASLVWYSKDNGSTWTTLPTPLNVREKEKAIEGDLAVDAVGNVYFLDTYGPDNVLTVWGSDQVMRSTRPIHGTLVVDDRPWLAAHGTGIVYAAVNGLIPVPAPNTAPTAARYWFFKSTDGGTTWSTGHGFADSGYCHLAASPLDDVTVVVACIGPGLAAIGRTPFVEAYLSRDQGTTWSRTELASNPENPGSANPAVSFNALGQAAVVWPAGTATIGVAVHDGTAWLARKDIQVNGTLASPWIAGGPQGEWAVAAYVKTADGWRLDAWREQNATWEHQIVYATPLSQADRAPRDFFQTAYDGQGRLNLAFQDDMVPASLFPGTPYMQGIKFARQQ